MLLNLTTDKLSLVTSEACDVDVVVTYIDRTISTGAVGAANRQITNITTGTTTDILDAPASDTERKVLELSIRNAHASTSVDVLPQFNANGTLYELHAARLYATEKLEWDEHQGFEHIRRRDIPVFERRMSEQDTRFSGVVTGNDATMGQMYKSAVHIQPSKAGNLVRVVANFSYFHRLAAATTTGIGLGLLAPVVGFSDSRNSSIMALTASVTAAGKSCQSQVGGDALTANGTSAVTHLPGITAGEYKWTEAATDLPHTAMFGVQSEVAASQVTLSKGTFVEVFEATK